MNVTTLEDILGILCQLDAGDLDMEEAAMEILNMAKAAGARAESS